MFGNFRYNRIPALLLAAALCYPSIAAIFLSPSAVLTSYGVSPRIASAKEARIVDAAGNARMLCLGSLMFYSYRRGDYRVLDTFLASASTIGIVECIALGILGIGLFLYSGSLPCLSFLSWGLLKLLSFTESCQPEAMPRHARSISPAGCRSPTCWACFIYAGTVSEH